MADATGEADAAKTDAQQGGVRTRRERASGRCAGVGESGGRGRDFQVSAGAGFRHGDHGAMD